MEYVELTEEEEKKALLTMDPISEMAKADAEKLDSLLRDVSLSSESLADMLGDLAKKAGCEWATGGGVTEDEAPAPPVVPITKPGDLWVLGRHRLLCGDSTKAEDVRRLMAGERAGLMSPQLSRESLHGRSGNSESAFRHSCLVAGRSDHCEDSDLGRFGECRPGFNHGPQASIAPRQRRPGSISCGKCAGFCAA